MTQVESHSSRRARHASHSVRPDTRPDSWHDMQPDAPTTSFRRQAPALPVAPSGARSRGGRESVRTVLPRRRMRGRHATTYGQGFGWVVMWSIVAAAMPGAALIAAGRRRLGWPVLVLQGLAVLALLWVASSGDAIDQALKLAISPTKLLLVTAAVLAVAMVWVVLLLVTTAQLRREAALTRPQRAFAGLVTLALVAAVAMPAYLVGSSAIITRDLIGSTFGVSGSGTAIDTENADPWADLPRVNLLLMGSDAGRNRTGVRPDTLVLASIDTRSGNTVLFSLPRNLGHVPFPLGTPGNAAYPDGFWCVNASGLNDCMLNAVWQWAEDNPSSGYTGENRGLEATMDAVQGALGLPVDGYVMLNLKGFQQFIDAIGGLRIDVSQRLPMGGNDSNRVATHGYLEPGKNQLLTGWQTLWFARSRWSTNDYNRMERQRCVIAAVVDQADAATLAVNFPSIAKVVKNNLSTSIGQGELQAWVELAQRAQRGKITSLAFTNEVLPDRDNPDYALIQKLVATSVANSVKVTTTPTSGSTPGAKPAPTKKPVRVVDPSKAQNVQDVC